MKPVEPFSGSIHLAADDRWRRTRHRRAIEQIVPSITFARSAITRHDAI